MSQTKAELINAKGDAAFDTDTLYIDSTNNRVGVGVTPSQRLHVGNTADNTKLLVSSSFEAALELQNGGGSELNVINSAGSGNLSFRVSNSEKARLDSSGRLLVGTSSTATAGDSASAKVQILANTASSSGDALLSLQRGQAAASISSDSPLGKIVFADNAGNEYGVIQCRTDAASGSGDYPGRLVFSTTADGASSPTSRVVINSSGATIFGTNTTTWSFNANNTQINSSGAFIKGCSTTAAVDHCVFYNPNGKVGSIVTSASATAYNTSSDYRLKENVTAVIDGITRLQQLKPSRFNFIADPDTTVDGFLAHEVQDIVPEAITGEKDAVDDEGNPIYQGIDQSKLVPLLTAALQEAIGEIESLKARVAALESA